MWWKGGLACLCACSAFAIGLSVNQADLPGAGWSEALGPGIACAQTDFGTSSSPGLIPLQGTVSIQCDDGAYSNYVLAESLAVRGVPAAFAVVTDYVNLGHPSYMNWGDLSRLVSIGHSIMDHSTSHNPQIGLMSDAGKDAELAASKSALESHGLSPQVWVAPGGTGFANWWSLMRGTISKYYSLGATPNGWNNPNPSVGIDSVGAYAIGAYPPEPSLAWTVPQVKSMLAQKLARNEWTVLKFHGTPDSVVAKVLAVVDWLRANDVPIVPVDDEGSLWYYGRFDVYRDIFTDSEFERDMDANGVPDNCTVLGQSNRLVTDGRYGLVPGGGERYMLITGYACQFKVGGVMRGTPYTVSFWAKATQPGGGAIRFRIYEEKHGDYPANSGAFHEILANLPDSSWRYVDSLFVPSCNFATNDSTEIFRLFLFSYSNPDSGVCLAKPSLVPLASAPPVTPAALELRCQPNPASASVTLTYELQDTARVRIEVFDVQGRLVQVLDRRTESGGPHVAVWDTRRSDGRKVGPGIYLLRLRAGKAERSQKVVVLR